MTVNGTTGPRVLLIGQRTSWGSSLIAMLEASRCTVLFASDLKAAAHWIEAGQDLILAGLECRHGMHLSPGLLGSRTSLFYLFPVENSCWWVLALQRGVDCYGSSALRPTEFAAELKELLDRHTGQTMKAAS